MKWRQVRHCGFKYALELKWYEMEQNIIHLQSIFGITDDIITDTWYCYKPDTDIPRHSLSLNWTENRVKQQIMRKNYDLTQIKPRMMVLKFAGYTFSET